MKQIFNTNFNHGSLNVILLIFRVVLGAFMMVHGYAKLQGVLAGGEIQFMDPIGIGQAGSLYLAIFAEFFCSIFLILGLATRLAVIPLIITMLVVIFVALGSAPFEKKELALHYLLAYFLILIIGAGKYSLDFFISRNNSKRRR
ncbi:putative oxidoreductase [Pedobacter sp. UYP24]